MIDLPEQDRLVAKRLFGDNLGTAQSYARILAVEGIEWGLIGPREASRLWDRHVINSVCVAPLISLGATVVDAGSGAGLPGIPLAIARPDLTICLVEPMQRRVEFLTMAVERLGLERTVSVVRARIEEFSDRTDVVTCRAVASLESLITMVTPVNAPGRGVRSGGSTQQTRSRPSVRRGTQGSAYSRHHGLEWGELLAIKGERAHHEVADAETVLSRNGLAAEVIQPEVDGRILGSVVRVWSSKARH